LFYIKEKMLYYRHFPEAMISKKKECSIVIKDHIRRKCYLILYSFFFFLLPSFSLSLSGCMYWSFYAATLIEGGKTNKHVHIIGA
jgi:hypothetical protein